MKNVIKIYGRLDGSSEWKLLTDTSMRGKSFSEVIIDEPAPSGAIHEIDFSELTRGARDEKKDR